MNKTFAIALGFALAFNSPAQAETYLNPDRAWWGAFFQAVDGATPDYEAIARRDPAFLAADEFNLSLIHI